MLNRHQIQNYRLLKGLSTRDVAAYCEISQPLIVEIENGKRAVTEYNQKQITDGINKAYEAKKNGTFVKPPRVNVPKTKVKDDNNEAKKETQVKTDEKPKKKRGRPPKKKVEEKEKEDKKK